MDAPLTREPEKSSDTIREHDKDEHRSRCRVHAVLRSLPSSVTERENVATDKDEHEVPLRSALEPVCMRFLLDHCYARCQSPYVRGRLNLWPCPQGIDNPGATWEPCSTLTVSTGRPLFSRSEKLGRIEKMNNFIIYFSYNIQTTWWEACRIGTSLPVVRYVEVSREVSRDQQLVKLHWRPRRSSARDACWPGRMRW
jgi:hypothetical protein